MADIDEDYLSFDLRFLVGFQEFRKITVTTAQQFE